MSEVLLSTKAKSENGECPTCAGAGGGWIWVGSTEGKFADQSYHRMHMLNVATCPVCKGTGKSRIAITE